MLDCVPVFSARCKDETTTNQPATTYHKRTSLNNLLGLCFQNVRGLRTILDLWTLLSSFDYDALVFKETWLRDDICSTELSSDYCFFRCDSSVLASEFSRGEGVFITIKCSLNCISVSLSDCDQLEQVIVRIMLSPQSIFVSSIYLRPKSSPNWYWTHSNAIVNILG